MASRKSRPYPKTNSLAFSKVDCHTCLQFEQVCDRQRPYCRTCSQSKRGCGGYAVDLKWKGENFRDNHRIQRHLCQKFSAGDDERGRAKASDQSFKFVNATSKRRRTNTSHNDAFKKFTTTFGLSDDKDRNAPGTVVRVSTNIPDVSSSQTHGPLEFGSYSGASDGDDEASLDTYSGFYAIQPATQSWPLWLNIDSDDGFSVPNSRSGDLSSLDFVNEVESSSSEDHINAFSGVILESQTASHTSNELQLSGVLFNNLVHKWGAIIDMYNREFCVLPLTQDCLSNPFRVQKNSCEDSTFLLHAVLALASQHIAKKDRSTSLLVETLDHQATALKLFRQALTHTSPFTLLDTLLLLVNFEATQSASSTWSIHLNAALKILAGIGISVACQRNSRTRAQIAMLIWWDTTLAFISRKDLVFPLHYLQTLMQHGSEEGWTYFQLNGCPAELLMFMAQFSKLAAAYAKAEPLGCFNDLPVRLLVGEVENWKNPEDGTVSDIGQTDIDPNCRRNRFHCIEAWRHAIVLYAHRVFRKKQSAQDVRSITHLARVILDHVRCIPDTETVQKQTLLPVFLAAVEVGDGITRSWVRSYCDRWTVTARYDMFGTTAALLDLVWADWLPETRDIYWWGSKIGHTSEEPGNESLISEILLG